MPHKKSGKLTRGEMKGVTKDEAVILKETRNLIKETKSQRFTNAIKTNEGIKNATEVLDQGLENLDELQSRAYENSAAYKEARMQKAQLKATKSELKLVNIANATARKKEDIDRQLAAAREGKISGLKGFVKNSVGKVRSLTGSTKDLEKEERGGQ